MLYAESLNHAVNMPFQSINTIFLYKYDSKKWNINTSWSISSHGFSLFNDLQTCRASVVSIMNVYFSCMSCNHLGCKKINHAYSSLHCHCVLFFLSKRIVLLNCWPRKNTRNIPLHPSLLRISNPDLLSKTLTFYLRPSPLFEQSKLKCTRIWLQQFFYYFKVKTVTVKKVCGLLIQCLYL